MVDKPSDRAATSRVDNQVIAKSYKVVALSSLATAL